MKKSMKLIALLLASLMLMTSIAFAATSSKEEPGDKTKKQTGRYTEYITYSDGTAAVRGTKKSTYNHKIKRIFKTTKIKGKKYTITQINKNAFAKMKKLKIVKVYSTRALKVQKGAFGKLNTKKITVKVTKKMSAKNFKKFKKNLRKAGFKGKIVRVKL
ncbi:MAG: hypothetical protein IJH41_03010 [Eubacterium sp.]|nr:hypothetical protein [Eubacterium sp.]